MTGRCVLALSVLCGVALSHSAAAETWFLKGGGKHVAGTSNGTAFDWGYDWHATGDICNWTNAVGEAGVPAEGDSVVIPVKDPVSGSGSVVFSANAGNGSRTNPLDAFTAPGQTCLHQGTLVMRSGGEGISIGGNSTWWSGISCVEGDDPDGKGVVLTVASGKTFSLQKGVVSSGPSFTKAGAGKFENFCQGDDVYASADLKDVVVRLQGGTFVNNMSRPAKNVRFVFDSNDGDVRLALGRTGTSRYWDWSIEDGAIEESDAVRNTAHGITTTHSDRNHYLAFTGTPAVDPMRFTGSFYEKAGLMWNPSSSDSEFSIAKSVSPTAGGLLVSNGVVRLSAGASFTKLSRLDVAGAGARLVVEQGAGAAFQAQDARIADGGKVSVGQGVILSFASATLDGAAIAPGFHTAATAEWIEGLGAVYVAGGEEAADASSATWTGGGADTLFATAANWDGGETPDLATGGCTAAFAAGGERATFAGDGLLRLAGIVFTRPFTLDTADGATGMMTLGSGGVATPASDAAGTYDLGWPFAVAAPQTWTAEANATVRWTAPVSGLSTSDRILVDGAGQMEFLAANSFPNDMMVTNGTVRFAGDGSLGASSGTTWGDVQRALFVFGGGTQSRPVQLFAPLNNGGAKGDRIVFEAGTTNRFDGKFMLGVEGGQFQSMETSADFRGGSETVFAGGLRFNYLNCDVTAGAGAAHVVVTNEPMASRDRFCLQSRSLLFDLCVASNRVSGNRSFWNAGTLRTLVPYALEKNAQNCKSRVEMGGSQFTLDLCGNDQSMGVLVGKNGTITSETPAFFHLAQNHVPQWWDNDNVDGVPCAGITNAVRFTGMAGLSLDAERDDFPHVLTAASSSTGTVQVTAGRLTFAAPNGSWTNAAAVVVKGGELVLEHSRAIGRETDVFFEGASGRMELAAGVTQKCRDLYFDGVRQRPGTYGSSQSGAQYRDDARFAGAGALNVLSDGKGFMLIFR